MANPVGRPSKLTPELIIKAQEYVDNFDKEPFNDIIPMVEGMALHINVARETIHAWVREETNADFSHIVKQMMSKQAKTLINGGVSGVYNASITKLMLTKHDYSDKVDSDITSGGEKVASTWVLAGVSAKDE